jgi:hypothetical protein
MFFRGKYRVGVKVVSWEITHGVGWTVGGGGGGGPVGEEVRNHWTQKKQYCRVLGAEPVRL